MTQAKTTPVQLHDYINYNKYLYAAMEYANQIETILHSLVL